MVNFYMFDQNIDCMYMLEPPRRGGSNEYPQSMFTLVNVKVLELVATHWCSLNYALE